MLLCTALTWFSAAWRLGGRLSQQGACMSQAGFIQQPEAAIECGCGGPDIVVFHEGQQGSFEGVKLLSVFRRAAVVIGYRIEELLTIRKPPAAHLSIALIKCFLIGLGLLPGQFLTWASKNLRDRSPQRLPLGFGRLALRYRLGAPVECQQQGLAEVIGYRIEELLTIRKPPAAHLSIALIKCFLIGLGLLPGQFLTWASKNLRDRSPQRLPLGFGRLALRYRLGAPVECQQQGLA